MSLKSCHFALRILSVSVNGVTERLMVRELREVRELQEGTIDCLVLVYALDDKQSFGKVEFLSTSEIFQPLDLVSDTLNSLKERDGLRDRAVIVVGNKSDLERSREVSSRQGVDLAIEYQVKFTETSAG